MKKNVTKKGYKSIFSSSGVAMTQDVGKDYKKKINRKNCTEHKVVKKIPLVSINHETLPYICCISTLVA